MTRHKLALVALLAFAASSPACGKYGKPVRVSSTPPAAGVGGQQAAAAPAGEECEEEVQDEDAEDEEAGLDP